MQRSRKTATRQLTTSWTSAFASGLPDSLTQQLRAKRKNSSTACDNCRLKRIKCTGGSSPCANCVKLDIPCHIDTHSDQRRKAVTKVKLEELEQDQKLLNALLKTLRNPPDENTDQTIASILQNASNHVDDEETRQPESDTSSSDAFVECLEPDDNRSGMLLRHSKTSIINTYSANMHRLQGPVFNGYADDDNDITHSETPISRGGMHMVYEERMPWRRTKSKAKFEASYIVPGAVRSFGNLSMSDAIRANGYPADIQARQLEIIHGSIETCLPLHTPVDLDDANYAAVSSVLSFQAAARSLIAQGVAARTVLSMDTFDLCLFFRDRMPDDEHTVANWACEWGKAWIGFPTAIRLAATYYAGSLMRWLILPCRETYTMMCPLARPLTCQLMVPHTMAVDLWCATPVIREIQLLHSTDLLSRVTTTTQCLKWEHDTDSCTEKSDVPCNAASPGAVSDGQGGFTRSVETFSPQFIACLDNAESWSVHRKLVREMPELFGRVRIHDD